MKRALLLCWLAAAPCAFAGLTFDETTKSAAVTDDALASTFDFTFTNTGDQPVKIDHYDAGCPCVSVALQGGKVYYKPGEKGVMRAVFDVSAFSGKTRKELKIWLDGAPEAKPSNTLTLQVDIPTPVVLEPRTLVWEIGSAVESKTAVITVSGGQPIRALRVSSGDDKFITELKTIEEGRKYELVVTPKSTQAAAVASVRVNTDSSAKKYEVLMAFAAVKAPADQIRDEP
ncbi:MAG: hypothetical protein JWO82_1916 [Akkermansiaceae bacterium]|nr:hypothetical protein [Akkermansiaceae bacterium]